MDLTSLTIMQARKYMKEGLFSPVDLVEACLQRIQAYDESLHSFISVDIEGSLRAAHNAARLGAGSLDEKPLLGIPIAVKDLYNVQGQPTTAGSPLLGNTPSKTDATTIKRLKEAGSIILGKCNLNEWAIGATGENDYFGTVCNPWDKTRISGGSSSGSAAAIAAGFVPATLGSDSGGSIRVPASLCGVVGMKPSFGRISLEGVLPLSWTLDHAGPMARSVHDVALLLDVLGGSDPFDERTWILPNESYKDNIEENISGWRVAIPEIHLFTACSEDILSMMSHVEHALESLGAIITHVALDWVLEARIKNRTIIAVESYVLHQDQLEKNPEKFSEPVLERLHRGKLISSEEYARALLARSKYRQMCRALFNQVDVLITPTTPFAAPRRSIEEEMIYAREHISTFLGAFNLTGLPAISIPWTLNTEGLPLGLQIIGGEGQDRTALIAARAIEQLGKQPNLAPL